MKMSNKVAYFAGGIAAAGALVGASRAKSVRKLAVSGVAKCMEISESVQAGTQTLIDEAEDVRAEAKRQRRINAEIAARIAQVEDDIRKEVVAEVDGVPAHSAKGIAEA